jgi:hypothetical protein
MWLLQGGLLKWSGAKNKCMTAKGTKLATNTRVGLETCTGKASQKWGMDASGRISVGGAQQLCLAPVADSFHPGEGVRLFTCTYYLEQGWKFHAGVKAPPIPAPNWNMAVNVVSEYSPAHCLDVPGGKGVAGNVLDLWECNGLFNQQWIFNKDDTVSYLGNMSLCIDISGTPKKGSSMALQMCNTKSATQKVKYDLQTGFFNMSPHCLDIPGAKIQNGSKIWLWECNKQPQQQWYISNAYDSYTSDIQI